MGKKTYEYEGTTYFTIPEHDGYYASKDGKILSLVRKDKPLIMKQMYGTRNHKYVYMYKDKKMQKVWVHRAVRSAIDGEDKKDMICRHLDDNPDNNNVENLAWGTIQDNADDRGKNRGYENGTKSSFSKLTDEKVMDIRRRYSEGESSKSLSSEYGVARNTILQIVRGNKWKHLPTIPVAAPHSTRRLTPLSEEEKERFANEGRKYASSIKNSRELVPCACGCGTMIPMHDKKGRRKYFVRGHNQTGKHWEWSEKNGKED